MKRVLFSVVTMTLLSLSFGVVIQQANAVSGTVTTGCIQTSTVSYTGNSGANVITIPFKPINFATIDKNALSNTADALFWYDPLSDMILDVAQTVVFANSGMLTNTTLDVNALSIAATGNLNTAGHQYNLILEGSLTCTSTTTTVINYGGGGGITGPYTNNTNTIQPGGGVSGCTTTTSSYMALNGTIIYTPTTNCPYSQITNINPLGLIIMALIGIVAFAFVIGRVRNSGKNFASPGRSLL